MELTRRQRQAETLERATAKVDGSARFIAENAHVDELRRALEKEKRDGETQSRLEAAGAWNRARIAYEKERAEAIEAESGSK
jgi:hypothetical protein